MEEPIFSNLTSKAILTVDGGICGGNERPDGGWNETQTCGDSPNQYYFPQLCVYLNSGELDYSIQLQWRENSSASWVNLDSPATSSYNPYGSYSHVAWSGGLQGSTYYLMYFFNSSCAYAVTSAENGNQLRYIVSVPNSDAAHTSAPITIVTKYPWI
jgi:hypothetical protein